MADLHHICGQMNVKPFSAKRRSHPGGDKLPARHTWARATIKQVHDDGLKAGLPEHVYDVLGLILESDPTQLYGDVISAVSVWALRWRITTDEMGFVLPAFRALDIKAIRGAVHHHKLPERAAQIAFLISGTMEPALRKIGK